MLAAGAVVLAGGVAVGCGGEEQQPVDSAAIPPAVTKIAREIATIPTTRIEIAAVREDTRELFEGRAGATTIHIDEATGQPYHVANSYDPRGAQVVRIIASRDGRGSYQFVMNERLDRDGNLDPSETSFLSVAADRPAADYKGSLSMSLLDETVPVDRSSVLVASGDTWSGSVTSAGLIESTLTTATDLRLLAGSLVLTADRLDDMTTFMHQTAQDARVQAPVGALTAPGLLTQNP